MKSSAKAILVVTALVAVAAAVASIVAFRRLQELEARSALVGLHHVRISCVDAVSGASLKPMLVNIPTAESHILAEQQPGAVSVYWSGLKSDGNFIGAGANGYEVKLLPGDWRETQDVVLRLSRVETKNAEEGVPPQSATRSESDSEGGDKPQPEAEPRPR